MPRFLRSRKFLLAVGLVATLLVVALWPTAVAVDVGTVSRGLLRITIDEEGETRVHDRFVVSAPVSGRVLRIELEPGDRVTKNETLLATFLPAAPAPLDARSRAEAEAAVAAARATLGQARAQQQRSATALEFAESESRRFRELQDGGIASPQAVEQRETTEREAQRASEAAEYAVATAEHQLEMAKARLLQASGGGTAPIQLRSPIDGVVLKRFRESEAVVPVGEPLLELGDPRGLEIVSDLLSTDAVKVRAGQPVLLEQWGGDQPLRARVRRVEPSGFLKISALGVEEQRVNVVMDFDDPMEAWRALGDGYRVEVRIVIWEEPDVLRLPTSALFRRGQGWSVFAVEAGRVHTRPVEIGRRNGLEAQVLSGLDEGAEVVVHPSDTLEDGNRVEARAS